MTRITANCGKHVWDLGDFDARCQRILWKFNEIHPMAADWKLGLLIGAELKIQVKVDNASLM